MEGAASPSISFFEFAGDYDRARDRLDVRMVCRFPFSGQPSFVGAMHVEDCGLNGADVTLGRVFEGGIPITPPLLPVKLKAGQDLVVRLDHICDRDPFLIYLGARATLCVDLAAACVAIRGEFFRIADLGTAYQHPLNFDIRGGTLTVVLTSCRAGDWMLRVADHAAGDEGGLLGWCIEMDRR